MIQHWNLYKVKVVRFFRCRFGCLFVWMGVLGVYSQELVFSRPQVIFSGSQTHLEKKKRNTFEIFLRTFYK